MALGFSNERRSTYLSIANGSIVRRVNSLSDDPNAVARTTQSNTTVYEVNYDYIDGYITGIEIGSSTFQGNTTEKAQWKVRIKDNGEDYIVTVPYSSSYSRSLINRLASIKDFSQKVRIWPWKMPNPDKADAHWIGVTIYRPPFNGSDRPAKEQKIEAAFDRNAIPPMKEVMLRGKTQWDDTEQMEFFENIVNTIITPLIQKAHADVAFASIPSAFSGQPAFADEDPQEPDLEHKELPF